MPNRPLKAIDFKIDLTATRKASRWGYRIFDEPSLARMGAGSLRSGTRCTLLSYALLAALKSASRSACARIFVANGECTTRVEAMDHPRKLKVLVRCSDKTFLDAAVDAATKVALNRHRSEYHRAAKTVWHELTREMQRFSMRFELVDEGKVSACRDWSLRVLPRKTHPCGFPLPEAIVSTPETQL